MRLRLFLSFLLIVLVTTVAVVLLTTWRIRGDVVTFISRGGLSGNAQLVEDLEAHYRMMGNWDQADMVMIGQHAGAGQGNQMGMQGATLADASGKVLVGRGRHMNGPGQGRQEALTEEEINQAIALYDNGVLIGYLLPDVRIAPVPGIESALLQRLTRSALTAAGIAASLSLILAFLLAYVLLRPVRELTKAAGAMSRGDLTQRVEPRGGGETALLARTFNEMAESLQQAESRRKALTADIAHELRNPLAVQRANIEAMQDGLYPLTPEQLEPLRQQNLQLEHLVEDLRTLALADAGHLSLERVPTDLSALLKRRLAEISPEAEGKNVRLLLDARPDEEHLLIDPARIGQIIHNLVANALRYSPEGSEVRISRSDTAEFVRISVRDQGPGINPKDLPHIFERFYRGDRARSRDSGGTGLGLSIARRLAEAHGGSLDAVNHPDGGAEFTLTLPR